MSGGGGGGTQTVRTELDPSMRPYVEYGLQEARGLYESQLPQFYPGQTYVGPSQLTESALRMAQQRALTGSPLIQQSQQTAQSLQTALNPALGAYGDIYNRATQNPATGFYQNVAAGGMTDVANQQRANQMYGQAGYDPAANVYGSLAGGGMANVAGAQRANQLYQQAGYDPASGLYGALSSGGLSDVANMQRANQIYGQAAAGDPSANFYRAMQQGAFQNAAMQGTGATASGAYLGGNPFFQGAFTAGTRQAQDVFNRGIQDVSSQASKAGRYGSGAMGQLQDRASGQFAQAVTDTASKLAYENYAAERAMQEAAMGRLGALSQQDVQNRLTGAQSLSGASQQTLANQMAAMQASAGLSQQDIANRLAGGQALTAGARATQAERMAAAQQANQVAQQDIQNVLSGATALTAGARAAQAERQAALQQSAALQQQAFANQMAGAGALSDITQQGLATQLSAAGGLGSTAAQDYARQLSAAQLAPTLAAQDYADIQRLLDVGQMQESYQEAALADAMQRFNFQQMQPYNKLQSYLSAAYGAPIGMQTSQPIFRNQVGSAVSGGLAGYGLGNLAGDYGGLGAAAGAALGGLLG